MLVLEGKDYLRAETVVKYVDKKLSLSLVGFNTEAFSHLAGSPHPTHYLLAVPFFFMFCFFIGAFVEAFDLEGNRLTCLR